MNSNIWNCSHKVDLLAAFFYNRPVENNKGRERWHI